MSKRKGESIMTGVEQGYETGRSMGTIPAGTRGEEAFELCEL